MTLWFFDCSEPNLWVSLDEKCVCLVTRSCKSLHDHTRPRSLSLSRNSTTSATKWCKTLSIFSQTTPTSNRRIPYLPYPSLSVFLSRYCCQMNLCNFCENVIFLPRALFTPPFKTHVNTNCQKLIVNNLGFSLLFFPRMLIWM